MRNYNLIGNNINGIITLPDVVIDGNLQVLGASLNNFNNVKITNLTTDNLILNSGNISLGSGSNLDRLQGVNAIAIGTNSGQFSQNNNAIALGPAAGGEYQGLFGISLGYGAGNQFQGDYGVAIGYLAGQTSQSQNAISIGYQSGNTNQFEGAISIGYSSATFNQKQRAIAIGYFSGYNNQNSNAVAIGTNAGNTSQGSSSVAIGDGAGQISQGSSSVAIGNVAGQTNQKQNAVAIGNVSGSFIQGLDAVAIGSNAGSALQGNYSIAIGSSAGASNQHANSIILNASGSVLNSITSGSFYVAPIRSLSSQTQGQLLAYNTVTDEISSISNFVINTSGNIGIGTTSPTQKVHNVGNILTNRVYYTDQPHFYVTGVTGGSTTGFADCTFSTVVFQSSSGNWSTSSNLFTAPVAGLYHFLASFLVTMGPCVQIVVALRRSTEATEYRIFQGGNATQCANGSIMLKLDANETVKLQMYFDVARPTVISQNKEYSWFSGRLIG